MSKRPLFVVCGLLAVIVSACGGGGSTSSLPQGSSSGSGASGGSSGASVTLGSNSGAGTLPQAGSISGIITYPGGSGSVSPSTAVSAPGSLTPLQSSTRSTGTTVQATFRQTTAGTTNVPVVYITFSSTAGATLNTAPGFTINTSNTTGTPYEAEWNGTEWVTVGSAGTITAITSGSQISVGGGGPQITIPAGGAAYFVVYTGSPVPPSPSPSPSPSTKPSPSPSPTSTPSPLPSGVSPSPSPSPSPPIIADGGFEANSGAYTTFAASGGTISGTPGNTPGYGINGTIAAGVWTQCTVNAISSSFPGYSGGMSGTLGGPYGPSATAPPVTTYAPESAPVAVTTTANQPLQEGTYSPPAPTLASTLVYGGTYAALFGQLFDNYDAGDNRYNGLCQLITIPAGANPTFTAYVIGNGNEPDKYVENMIAVLDSTNTSQLDNILYMENVESATSAGDTSYRMISVPASATTGFGQYAGKGPIILFVGMWTKSGSNSNSMQDSSYWLVDNITLQ